MVTEEQPEVQIDFLDTPLAGDAAPVADTPVADTPVADTPVADVPVADVPVVSPPVVGEAAGTPPVAEAPAPVVQTNAELQALRQQAAEYEDVRMRAAFQQEANKVQGQLESQGLLPEHAKQAAQQHMQSRQAQAGLVKRSNEFSQELMAKQVATEQIAQKYKLGLRDLSVLRQADSPEMMEGLAKNISERRALEEEVSRLRQGQVPAQQYDNSQGSPDVAANDTNLLDRYNAGDRSPNAVAAARKAMGLG